MRRTIRNQSVACQAGAGSDVPTGRRRRNGRRARCTGIDANRDIPVFDGTHGRGHPAPVSLVRFDADHHRVELGPHAHQDLQLIFFPRGGGEHRVGGTSFDVRDGDVFLIPPGVVHDLAAMDPEARAWALDCPEAALTRRDGAPPSTLWRTNPFLNAFLAAELDPAVARCEVPVELRNDWDVRFTALERELAQERPGTRDAVAAHVLLFLIDIERLADATPQALQSLDPVLAATFELVERGFRSGLTVAKVAADLGYTPAHLTTRVRARTGRTLLEWISERQMAEARHLLSTTTDSVAKVGFRVGLPDPAYFSRRFRQHHGVPPSQWRATHQR